MPEYRPKPSSPRLVRGHPTAAGIQLVLPLHGTGNAAVAGRSLDFSGNGYVGVDTTTLARGPGPYGAQLSGFSVGNYLKIPATGSILAPILMTTYPCWMAVLFIGTTGTGTTASTLACSGGSASANYALLRLNQSGVAGVVDYFLSGSGGAPDAHAAGLPTADGNPHVTMAVSLAASNHLLYFDGLPAGGGSTVNVGTVAGDQFAVGGVTAGVGTANCAVPIAFVAAGNGAVPDPMALAVDWLRGDFSCVRPRRPLAATVAALADAQPVGITPGAASFVNSGPAGISVSAAEATNATGTPTHQWERSVTNATSGFGPLTGATNLTLTDPAPLNTDCWYRMAYTDPATSVTVRSNAVGPYRVYTGQSFGAGGFPRIGPALIGGLAG